MDRSETAYFVANAQRGTYNFEMYHFHRHTLYARLKKLLFGSCDRHAAAHISLKISAARVLLLITAINGSMYC